MYTRTHTWGILINRDSYGDIEVAIEIFMDTTLDIEIPWKEFNEDSEIPMDN